MVKITDTTLRDGHQSLFATRMRTEDMIPIAEAMDEMGFFSLEVWGGATFDSAMRFLNENSWDRPRTLKKYIKNTPLQMLLRGQNLVGYRHYPDDIVEKFVFKAVEAGIDIFRIFDALNDIRNMETAIKAVKKAGAHAQGSVVYTISPIHTLESFVEMAKKLEELGVDSICIKDMAGLMSPTVASKLVKMMKKELSVPIDLHTHSTAGWAPITYMKAVEAGVDIIDTAMSPFGFGTAQPATESMVASFKDTPYDTGMDLKKLEKIAEYFRVVEKKLRKYTRMEMRIADTRVLIYQVPGGMLSNLYNQLKEMKAEDKIEEVLAEVPKVRAEVGYPPLVTPLSQIVGTQAVMNVISGERWKMVTKEMRNYIKGLYGKPPGEIKEEIKKKVLGDEKPITARPADLLEPGFEKVKEEIGDLADNEEDVLSYALFPDVARKFFMRRKGLAEETPEPPKEGKKYKIWINGEEYFVNVEEMPQ
ncbi:oxaloacetate decarboxylase subunit alpha [Candidatus Aciduliprofundum boonei]|uniref:Conserved carboxylase region n=1 Tax=Aciduliprofundum boonei (strain DSM 19572 / T469) TaxID=439481 RepID=D3TAA9_ACIB4|nr:oxaloacetate decarboxylase subunit alpha [Candidatus Aciduliprofundum boonei]ADD09038.1 Conserved carboxylase region [Aciduliprofundum boonei T469]HII54447.1 oxaloacetate decarboxylase subunit alpha [Candidatus Aciduliprofundum boonei]